MKRFATVAACAVCFLAMTACTQESAGPAEQAGKKIDKAVEETKAEVGEAVEHTADKLEEAGETLRESTKE